MVEKEKGFHRNGNRRAIDLLKSVVEGEKGFHRNGNRRAIDLLIKINNPDVLLFLDVRTFFASNSVSG